MRIGKYEMSAKTANNLPRTLFRDIELSKYGHPSFLYYQSINESLQRLGFKVETKSGHHPFFFRII